MPTSFRAFVIAAISVLVAFPALPSVAAAQDGRTYSQAPEVAPSESPGTGAAVIATAKPVDIGLERGPSPSWIWGPDENSRYFLKTSFSGGSIAARLKATCDNQVTIYLNGKQVVSSDEWEEPVEADIERLIKPGRNELVAEVTNQGSAAGFICKIALKQPDGADSLRRFRCLVDGGRARGSRNDGHARVVAPLGQGPGATPSAGPRRLTASAGCSRSRRVFGSSGSLPSRATSLARGSASLFDGKGRLIVCDEGNHGLARVTPAPLDGNGETKVERLKAAVSGAKGLLVAFDSLYVCGNGRRGVGLYRLRDTDGDDQYDQVTHLKEIRGGGEHGPHGLRLTPDGKSIVLVAGNHTQTPAGFQSSLVPRNWGEDQLLPRQWDANGHAQGILAPGGWIARTDPDGKTWEIVSSGYRNSYDIAFNHEGRVIRL